MFSPALKFVAPSGDKNKVSPAGQSSIRDDKALKVRAEQVRLLYAQGPTAMTVAFLFSIVISGLLIDAGLDIRWGFAWFAASIIVHTCRSYFLVHAFHRANPAPAQMRRWEVMYAVGAFAASMLLFVAALLTGLISSFPHQLAVLYIVVTMSSAAVATLTSVLYVYVLYMIFPLLSGIAMALVIGGGRDVAMNFLAAAMAMVLITIGRTAVNVNRRIRDSFALRFENDDLLESLSAREKALQKQQHALMAMAISKPIASGDLSGALAEITETAGRTLGAVRVSVWLSDDGSSDVHLAHRYEAGGVQPVSDQTAAMPYAEIARHNYSALLKTHANGGLFVVENVRQDERTQDALYKHYLECGVTAILDAPIRLAGRTIGVLNLQCSGGERRWSLDEQNFVSSLADMVALSLDHHHRRQIEDALFQEKERAQVTLASIGDGVITTDMYGVIRYINPVSEYLTGWSTQETVGRPLNDVIRLIDEKTREPILGAFERCLARDQKFRLSGDTILINRNGNKEFSLEMTSSVMRDRQGGVMGMVMVLHDVTEMRKLTNQLSYQATHDALTGLINRHEFERRVSTALESARRENKTHALCYADVDQFKVVNDTCGHIAGDELLKQITAQLQAHIRGSDTLARLGGDEFGILLEYCPLDKACEIAEAMRRSVNDLRFAWQGKTFNVSICFGVVPLSEHSVNITELLSAADSACYISKELGRNRVHLYQPDDASVAQRQGEMQWVSRINEALEQDLFELYCQTILPISRNTDMPVHYELLLRMRDEKGGHIPPMAFLPAAERYSLMPAIDRWVIRNAFRAFNDREAAFADGSTCLSINLSGQSFSDDEFLNYVVEQLKANHVEPSKICFEITETAAIANMAKAARFMGILKEMGCRFALDDFGSGLSSFAYLKNLKVDYLKIDGQFVRDMVEDPVDAEMVEAINRVGHVMGIHTIAEFVENDAILDKLRSIGVDYAQGYGVDRPHPLRSHHADITKKFA